MFTIYGGKTEFNQWDQGQRVMNPKMVVGDRAVFRNASGETHPMFAYEYEGVVVADVPNDLLMMAMPILVDLCETTECRTSFRVIARDMPEGYERIDNTPCIPQAPTSSDGVFSWNDLPDKPFGEEELVVAPMEIIWDGNSNGRISVPISDYLNLVKVSEKTPAPNELKKGTLVVGDDTVTIGKDVVLLDATAEGTPLAGLVVEALGPSARLVVAAYEPAIYSGMTFPEAGLYFLQNTSSDSFVEKLNLDSVEQLVVTTIDPKYIKDMYYEKVISEPLNISWDGDMAGKQYYLFDESNGVTTYLCRVLDKALTLEDLSTGTMSMYSVEGDQELQLGTHVSPSDLSTFGVEGIGLMLDGAPLVVSLSNAAVFNGVQIEAGTYFLCAAIDGTPVMYISCFSNPEATIETTITHKLDNKYLDLAWLPVIVGEQYEEVISHEELVAANKKGASYVAALNWAPVLEAGTAIVIYNGTEYKCDVKKKTDADFITYLIGDAGAAGQQGFEATGEPFAILLVFTSAGGPVFGETTTDGDDGLSVGIAAPVYNKIPEEFLPTEEDAAERFVLSGTSYEEDRVTLVKILQTYNAKGAASCEYGGNIYSVIGIEVDTLDALATLLLTRSLWSGVSGICRYEMLTLRYETSNAAVMRPVMTETELYLDSSTSGSTKRFKITVDDSGTLTATEVT